MHKHLSAFLIFGLFLNCSSKKSAVQTGFEGNILPSFKLLLIDSTTYFNTDKIPIDKPFIVYSFGPKCPHSKIQMQEMLTHISVLNNVRIYAISPWPFEEIKKFYQEYQLYQYSNITVGYDYDNIFQTYYNVQGVPFTSIFGLDRKLKTSFIGQIKPSEIIDIVKR